MWANGSIRVSVAIDINDWPQMPLGCLYLSITANTITQREESAEPEKWDCMAEAEALLQTDTSKSTPAGKPHCSGEEIKDPCPFPISPLITDTNQRPRNVAFV